MYLTLRVTLTEIKDDGHYLSTIIIILIIIIVVNTRALTIDPLNALYRLSRPFKPKTAFSQF